jgi:phosphatidate cytidylyltransferase
VATAIVGMPLIIGAILLGDPSLTALVAVALAIGTFEFCHGAGMEWWDPMAVLAAAGSASLALVPHLGFVERDAALVAAIFAVLVVALRGLPATEGPKWPAAAAAILYIGWLGQYFVLVHDLPFGRDWLLLALLATFAGDTGAYFTGITVGRHKMAPAISPKKTWEGFGGGAVAAIGATVAVYALGAMQFDVAKALVLGAAIAVVGPLGDLAESMLKRGMGVKDASGLIPGHGGFLDRLDSLLFVVPVVYFFAVWAS